MHIIKLTNENLRDPLEAITGEKPSITVGIMQIKGETKFRLLIFVTRQFNYHICQYQFDIEQTTLCQKRTLYIGNLKDF
jgi:hypothetical protein